MLMFRRNSESFDDIGSLSLNEIQNGQRFEVAALMQMFEITYYKLVSEKKVIRNLKKIQ